MKLFLSILLIYLGVLKVSSQHLTYQNFELGDSTKVQLTSILSSYLNDQIKPEDVFTRFDIDSYKTIDIMKESISLGGSLYNISFETNILSIKSEGENYIVQAMLYWHNADLKEKPITVLGIMNFWFKSEDNRWKISNYLNYHTQSWSRRKVGNISYIYYPEYPFDIHKAKVAVDFHKKLFTVFEVKESSPLTYFIARNCDEINRMSGFEYFISEGSDSNICAFIDDANNIIYSTATFGESHLHEIIHTLNKHFPTSNPLLLIGLSAYINDAGSRGRDMLFHIKRFKEYVVNNNVNFEKFEDFENLDDYTNISYITGTLFCNAIYRKGGLALLKSYMSDTEDINIFKSKLKKDLKIKSFDTFFKAEIEIYLKQQKSLLYL